MMSTKTLRKSNTLPPGLLCKKAAVRWTAMQVSSPYQIPYSLNLLTTAFVATIKITPMTFLNRPTAVAKS